MPSALRLIRKPGSDWARATTEIMERQLATDAEGNFHLRLCEGAAAPRTAGWPGAGRRAGDRDFRCAATPGLRQPEAACEGDCGLVPYQRHPSEFCACAALCRL